MKLVTIRINKDTVRAGERVQRYVCRRGHPHPSSSGAAVCEANVDAGLTDAQLLILFNQEVFEFAAPPTASGSLELGGSADVRAA